MKAKQDSDEVLKLRYYYSFHPVFFKEPENFWAGNFAEAYREGKVAFQEVIEDLMRENGKYEDRVDEHIVRAELEKAVKGGIIPSSSEFFNDLSKPETIGRVWVSQQEK